MDYAKNEKGQTLIALLFFVLVGVIVTVAAVLILSTISAAASKLTQGEVTRQLAETGIENAFITLLRDKNYTGETMTVGDATILISVTGTTNKIIDVTATSGDFVRKIEATVIYDGVLVPGSWKEIN